MSEEPTQVKRIMLGIAFILIIGGIISPFYFEDDKIQIISQVILFPLGLVFFIFSATEEDPYWGRHFALLFLVSISLIVIGFVNAFFVPTGILTAGAGAVYLVLGLFMGMN